MRTTVTFDDDVALAIEREMKASDRSFKETVNALVRRGLAASRTKTQRPKFRVVARDLGQRPGFDMDKISELIEEIEGPFHR